MYVIIGILGCVITLQSIKKNSVAFEIKCKRKVLRVQWIGNVKKFWPNAGPDHWRKIAHEHHFDAEIAYFCNVTLHSGLKRTVIWEWGREGNRRLGKRRPMHRWIQDTEDILGMRIREEKGLTTSGESFGQAGKRAAFRGTCYTNI